MTTIAVILGSVRPNRAGASVAEWVASKANEVEGVQAEILDLATFSLPIFAEELPPMMAPAKDPAAVAWNEALAGFDAFIIVSPEYNHSVPGGLKNAVDHLGGEWLGKPVAFVGYGADGAVRAVEHWRQIFGNFDAKAIRAQLSINIFAEMTENGFVPNERRAGELDALLDSLIAAVG